MGPHETALALIRLAAVARGAEEHLGRGQDGRETPIELDLFTAFTASPTLVRELEMTPPDSWLYGKVRRADLVGVGQPYAPNVELKVWSETSILKDLGEHVHTKRGQFQYMVDGSTTDADLVLIAPTWRAPKLTPLFRGDRWRVVTLEAVASACDVALREPDVAAVADQMSPALREAVANQALRSARLL